MGKPVKVAAGQSRTSRAMMLLLVLVLASRPRLAEGNDRLQNMLLLSDGNWPFTSATLAVDIRWYPPRQTLVNNLTHALSGGGDSNVRVPPGLVYDASSGAPPLRGAPYNWCNMPHVRSDEYGQEMPAADDWELVYAEIIHRHHRRTPYRANSFPQEPYPWDGGEGCGAAVVSYSTPTAGQEKPRPVYWQGTGTGGVDEAGYNPFRSAGWQGTCQFPQVTGAGLRDSWQHGVDLAGVYRDLLQLIPPWNDTEVRTPNGHVPGTRYRVTRNVITSQVAGMVVSGMWGNAASASSMSSAVPAVPLLVEPEGTDSLEPAYPCPAASAAFAAMRRSKAYLAYLEASAPIYAALDAISGISDLPPANQEASGFHGSIDHYYDNLSARQCHGKPLPCRRRQKTNGEDEEVCVTQEQADTVYRLGQWEYSFLYRDHQSSLAASAAGLGVWIAQLASHLREAAAAASSGRDEKKRATGDGISYFHNVAHDGSIARLLSVLQVDVMFWPGMGSEVAFELWRRKEEELADAAPGQRGPRSSTRGFHVRVLFGGTVLTSSHPALARMNMVPLETLLAYFDGLVGVRAGLVKAKCDGSIPLSFTKGQNYERSEAT